MEKIAIQQDFVDSPQKFGGSFSVATNPSAQKDFGATFLSTTLSKCSLGNNSIPAFTEVIETLQPQRILVLGKQNWKNLIENLEIEPQNEYSSTLKHGNLSAKIGYIKHPSTSLSYNDWNPIAQRLLFN